MIASSHIYRQPQQGLDLTIEPHAGQNSKDHQLLSSVHHLNLLYMNFARKEPLISMHGTGKTMIEGLY